MFSTCLSTVVISNLFLKMILFAPFFGKLGVFLPMGVNRYFSSVSHSWSSSGLRILASESSCSAFCAFIAILS